MTLKRIQLALSASIVLLSIVPSNAASGDRQQPATADKVVRETQEAVEATKQYTIQQKEAFTKKVHAELKEVQEKIAELRRKTDSASAEARAELQKALTDMEKQKNEARKKLDGVNEATSAVFGKVRDEVSMAVEDLKKRYKEALSKLP
jgi:predicted  nucleic acid-binding Zn-ribbon protein